MAKKLKDEVQEPGKTSASNGTFRNGAEWFTTKFPEETPEIYDDGGDEREPNVPWWQNSPIYNETPYDGIDDPEDVASDTYVSQPGDYAKPHTFSQDWYDLINRMGGSPGTGKGGTPDTDKGKNPPVNQGNTDITPAMAYLQQMQGMIDGIDLDKFKFDLNGEELYQQYRDQYLRNGRLAMMDTMGQAAGLTGGYGSSYAQNAGQQAYQGYVNELNAVVPQVYDRAYQRWGDEQDLKLRKYQLMADQYGRLLDQEDRDYTRQYNADKLASEEEIARIKADQADRESQRKYDFEREKIATGKEGNYHYEIGDDGGFQFVPNGYSIGDDGYLHKTEELSEEDEKLLNTVEKEIANLMAFDGRLWKLYSDTTGSGISGKSEDEATIDIIISELADKYNWTPAEASKATEYMYYWINGKE